MGTDRFGVLTIILTFLNYFGFFDLGIGRALTQLLAGRAHDDKKEEAALIWTVSALLTGLGVLAALVLFFAAPFVVSKIRIHGSLAVETILALRELGLTLPFLLHSLALRGILEARRRFDLSNLVRIPVGLFSFGAPILVLPFSHNLGVIVAVILGGRILAWLLNLWMILHIMPHLKHMRGWKPGDIWKLMRFGGWYTVSNVVGPVIDSMDRFFISTFMSISMVAYYTTPFELINKLGILSGSVGGAIFPEFALRIKENRREAETLFLRGFKYLLTVLFPFVLIATAYSTEALTWWSNPQFAALSAPVLQWLAIFVFITGSALIPLVFLQGVGRPDLSARMHLLELPVHAGLLYAFIKMDGIRGAAIACVLRVSLDFLGMLFFSGSILGFKSRTYGKMLAPMAGAIAVLLGFHIPMPPMLKAVLFLSVLALYVYLTWKVTLESRDKKLILNYLRKAKPA